MGAATGDAAPKATSTLVPAAPATPRSNIIEMTLRIVVRSTACRERTEQRLLLILSDGKPNDVDVYEGRS
jgi:hypothetical protein